MYKLLIKKVDKAKRTRSLDELRINIEFLATEIRLPCEYTRTEMRDMCNYMMELQQEHKRRTGTMYHPEKNEVSDR